MNMSVKYYPLPDLKQACIHHALQLTLESCKTWYVDCSIAFSIHPTHGKGSSVFWIPWSCLDGVCDGRWPTSRLNALGCEFIAILIKLK
jgi:hypothetical protein